MKNLTWIAGAGGLAALGYWYYNHVVEQVKNSVSTSIQSFKVHKVSLRELVFRLQVGIRNDSTWGFDMEHLNVTVAVMEENGSTTEIANGIPLQKVRIEGNGKTTSLPEIIIKASTLNVGVLALSFLSSKKVPKMVVTAKAKVGGEMIEETEVFDLNERNEN
ncbi:hypothetical protein [Algivirga pacifica]|uniref:Late embryogenesis abundant protein LEA-2 subgroup domain-containing protein n=1 Tax=Algivirga pacifica TaxID=1162670 RepID=A0ABP9DGM2_9BACT